MAAVLATSLSVAACSSTGGTPQALPSTVGTGAPTSASSATPSASAPAAAAYQAGTMLVSDGSDTVQIDDKPVKFPTTVTDAAFSMDGSRIVYVNGDGAIETARLDGSSRIAVTKADPKVKRSRPAWNQLGTMIFFTEKGADGVVRLKQAGVPLSGAAPSDPTVANYDRGREDAKAVGDSEPSTGGTRSAYQHKGAKGSEVWIIDHFERGGDEAVRLIDGSEPAMSADGNQVAFVGVNGDIEVMSIAPAVDNQPAPKPRQISAGAKSPTRLTWTPDGKTVVFSTDHDIESVAIGNQPAAPTQLSDRPGVATFLPAELDHIEHITGEDLIAQAIAASQSRWGTQTTTHAPAGGGGGWPTATNVVLTSSDDPSLAMIGAVRARSYLAPLLFTPKGSLDPRTASEISRALGKEPAENKTPDSNGDHYLDNVYIVGGTDVVSADVETAIGKLGYHVRRISGADVYSTAIAVQGLQPSPGTEDVSLVSADDPVAEAIAVSSRSGAVLLTKGTAIPDADLPILKDLSPQARVYAYGADAVTAAKSSWPGKPSGLTVVPATGTAAPQNGYLRQVVVVPTDSKQDAILGVLTAGYLEHAALYFVDPSTGPGPALTKLLDTGSAQIDTVAVIDSAGKLGGLDAKLGALTGGPLGAKTVTNPTAPDAQG